MQLTVQTNFPEVQRKLDTLRVEVAQQATVRAVNRTLEQAKTRMSRQIREEFNIPKAKVDVSLRINRASFRNGAFSISGSLESPAKRGRSLNVINFDARQTGKGVSVKIRRTGPRKVLTGAFIGNDGRTVFRRVGKARLPIQAVQTIDVQQMFNTKRINAVVVQLLKAKFPEIFEREAKYYTDRFNRS